MTMELFLILAGARAPTVAAWQRALRDQGIPLELTQEVDLRVSHALLPVILRDPQLGRAAGHERGHSLELRFSRDDYEQLEAAYPRLAKLNVRQPVVYTLGYAISLQESAAVFYSAAALVAEFGAKAFEPQLGGFMTVQDLLESAEGCCALAVPRAICRAPRVLQ